MECNKRNDFNNKIFMVIFLLSILTFFPLLNVKFTTNDDMNNALLSLSSSHFISTIIGIAKLQGRIFFIPSILLSRIPYLIDSIIYYKSIVFMALFSNIFLLGYCVKKIFKSDIYAFFTVIFFLFTIQFSWEHNLVTSYPFIFSFGWSMFILSIIFFYSYLEKKKISYQILSTLFFVFAIVTYEMYVLLISIFIIITLTFDRDTTTMKEYILKKIKSIFPLICVIFVYVILYFGFQHFYPSNYGGNKIGKFAPLSIFKVITQYSISSLPMYVFFHSKGLFLNITDSFVSFHYSIGYLVKNAKVEWIIKSILCIYVVYIILKSKSYIISIKKYLMTIFIALLLFLIPPILPALTLKYQDWVIKFGSFAYTVTYFSFFGTVLFFISTIFYFNQLVQKFKSITLIYIVFISMTCGVVSYVTDFSNYFYAKDQTFSNMKWDTFDLFLKTIEFNSIPSGSIIYAPSLWQYRGIAANNESYWSDYIKTRYKKNILVVENKDKFNALISSKDADYKDIYYIKYSQESNDANQYIVFSKIINIGYFGERNYLFSDDAHLFIYSKLKKYLVFFNLKEPSVENKIYINNKYISTVKKDFFSYQIDDTNHIGALMHTYIKSKEIDLESISLSNFTDYTQPLYEPIVKYEGDFFGLESDNSSNWRWCGKNGTISIDNPSSEDKEIIISMKLSTGYEENSDLNIKSTIFNDIIKVNSSETYYEKKFLIPKKSKINTSFLSNEKKVNAPDPRYLIFRIIDFQISTP